MPPNSPDVDALAHRTARTIRTGFDGYWSRFGEITRRGRSRFDSRDWPGMMADMGERLALHSREVDLVIAQLGAPLTAAASQSTWAAVKREYSVLVRQDANRELAETFFNSVARHMLGTIGKNAETEYDSEPSAVDPREADPAVVRRFEWRGDTAAVIRQVLAGAELEAAWDDPARDAAAVAAEIDSYLTGILGSNQLDAVEILSPVFLRQHLAYLIGRIRSRNHVLPLVLPLYNGERGIGVDAVLMSQSELSIVFSFTRSHFHVESERPRDLVVFLKRIMPLKPLAELYISLGFHKHGKTELYRGLRSHMATAIDRFVVAKGEQGMVMLVFTLPFYGLVFKVIRDRFAYPKRNTRQDVMDRYRLVFHHDRVGRLVEAQEFEHLEFPADRFDEGLLAELLREAASTVSLRDGAVVLKHLYVERKVTPLNLYLAEATEQEALEAVRDYGDAVKELAAANIFPGDFLLKNFGVTRHGRVVFYDYDELCLTTECKFRRMPIARHPEDELSAEPWFTVGENDIFPEEFSRFLGLRGPLLRDFEQHHRDLLDVEFWLDAQRRLRRGEILAVYPYPRQRRLAHRRRGEDGS